MIPEAELVRKEIILRKMDFPESVALTKNSLMRWCCLSLGLISPKETRDMAFIAFDALFTFIFTKKQSPTTLEIQDYIKQKKNITMSEKLIRYHLNRLIELNIIQRKKNSYSINPSPSSEKRNSLKESFNAWVKKETESQLEETARALELLQKAYEK